MTRYPKSGKGQRWTTIELRAVPPAWKGDTLSDGEGLSGEVRVTTTGAVSIRFKYAFRWEGKVRWYQCGTWPTTSLAEIRQKRDSAQNLVRDGVNPSDHTRAERHERQKAVEKSIAEAEQARIENLSVQNLFDVWIVDGVNRKDGNKELRRIFERDILPSIGGVPLRALKTRNIRDTLRPVREAGHVRKAQIMLLGIKQMFAWAEKEGKPWRPLLADGNPADRITEEQITPNDYEEERDRVLSAAEVKELANILERTTTEYENAPAGTKYQHERPLKKESQIAVWLCLGTICRIGELLMAEWEHVDLSAGTWFIPKENVKGRRKKKQDQLVYLSPFTLRQFKALHTLTGDTSWCFPSRDEEGHISLSSVSKQVGDRQERFMQRSKPLQRRKNNDTLVLADGKNGVWTIHDLRRTGATMMQELGISPDVIDRCQNHVMPGSKTRRSYLHYDFAKEKRDAWMRLGDRIDTILADNVTVIERRAG